MDLKQLQAIGAFVPSTAVKVEFTWKKSESEEVKGDIFIRRQSFGDFSILVDPERNKDKVSNAELIAKSLAKDETGKQDLLTYEQAYALHPGLAAVFVQAIWKANSPEKKGSPAKKSSGMSSSSPGSVDGQSQKQSET